MDFFIELIVLFASGYFLFSCLPKWYVSIFKTWPRERAKWEIGVLAGLPILFLADTLCTLQLYASYDVRDNFFYLLLYLLLGLVWQAAGVFLMGLLFDLSWRDDVLQMKNKAALVAFSGGYIGLGCIYCGANTGDGPGWWCVVFAGALGLVAWFLMGILIHAATGIFERIGVGRDIGAGIRFGSYLLASGLILARACGGDWTSFARTVVEFLDGWPVLPLAALAMIVERVYIFRANAGRNGGSSVPSAIFWGVVFVGGAIAAVILLPPTHVNPMYG